jgi:hypothetical protein
MSGSSKESDAGKMIFNTGNRCKLAPVNATASNRASSVSGFPSDDWKQCAADSTSRGAMATPWQS